MPAAISPYSMAVAPLSFFRNAINFDMVVFPPKRQQEKW
jgi:hypothetical protein